MFLVTYKSATLRARKDPARTAAFPANSSNCKRNVVSRIGSVSSRYAAAALWKM